MKKICVLGLGYIGLPIASLFATYGLKVTGVDIDKENIESIRKGKALASEPDLNIMTAAALKSGNLITSNKPTEADVFIIAVPTPKCNDNSCDLASVIHASESIVTYLNRDNLVILESTVPPGTTEEVVKPILEKSGLHAGKDFYLAHCPEKVLPGKILFELVQNERVFGGIDKKSFEETKKLYSTFVKGKIYGTNLKTAEFIKLIENSYRDVNIAFANELAKICRKLDMDIWESIWFANRHPRVNIHNPGPGVGGHCIAIDPWFIVNKAHELSKLITLARKINDSMPSYVVSIVSEAIKGIENPTISVLGAAYKAEIEDPRNSPAREIINLLKKMNFNVKVYDPYVKNFEYAFEPNIDAALKDSSCIIIVTDHNIFKEMSPERAARLVKDKILIDTRNCTDRENWKKSGFRWISI
ncbi:nucleotide sugar dehydrogenase [Candidatus Woesearchaeota archaeon]|nr:nucleotide sugar dehydrogenase [Candidatus Woesearchaeota archaeon]